MVPSSGKTKTKVVRQERVSKTVSSTSRLRVSNLLGSQDRCCPSSLKAHHSRQRNRTLSDRKNLISSGHKFRALNPAACHPSATLITKQMYFRECSAAKRTVQLPTLRPVPRFSMRGLPILQLSRSHLSGIHRPRSSILFLLCGG